MRILGSIDQEEYLSRLHDLDYDEWFKNIPQKDREVIKLTQQYNSGVISKEQYAEQIRHLDPDKWVKILDGNERQIAELDLKLERSQITKEEYTKGVKTIHKEPYITITNVTIEPGQIGMEFDWNEYFIQELKDNGFTGQSDQDIVDQWFTSFSTMVAAQSDKVIITDPDDIRRITKKSGKTEHF